MKGTPLLQRVSPWLLITVWLAVQLAWSLPKDIAVDWMGWRQADTQTIARNFLDGGDILHPRIAWGGDGPGTVEAEFQLYTYACAQVMRLTGSSVRPGQWLSLLSLAAAAGVLFTSLRRRWGYLPALLALAGLLASRGAVFVSSSVQPDALGFLFCTLALVAFLEYLEAGRGRQLVLAAMWTLLAALIKPTALHLGIFQFLAVCLLRRDLLRRPGLWLAWAAVLLGMGLFFWHGHQIYRDTGNTFGVGLTGDSKFPTLRVLASPASYLALARMSLAWGWGLPGAAAALYLLLRRKLDAVALALGLANLALLLVAFRYTSNEWYGPHYHLVTTLPAAWLTAAAVRDLTEVLGPGRRRRALVLALTVWFAVLWGQQLQLRRHQGLVMPEQRSSVAAGRALAPIAEPGDLVVVRSSAKARSDAYDTVNNFEDPLVFYVAGVRGWVVPADEARVAELQAAAAAGARFYVDTWGRLASPPLAEWLSGHAERIVHLDGGRAIYRLREPAAGAAAPDQAGASLPPGS